MTAAGVDCQRVVMVGHRIYRMAMGLDILRLFGQGADTLAVLGEVDIGYVEITTRSTAEDRP